MHWRRKWKPTPVFLPGESQGQRSLVGCCLWGRTESDTTETMQQQQYILPLMCLFELWFTHGLYLVVGFPHSSVGKESGLQCRRLGFNSWIGKIPWRRNWQPTPVFFPKESPWTEEPGGLQSMESSKSQKQLRD